MEHYTLGRLNECIRRAVAINFIEPVWLVAEVIQAKENKGHLYIDLIERNEQNDIIAQSSAVIWKTNISVLEKKYNLELGALCKVESEVRLLVNVEYHLRYGLKLNVQDIDVLFLQEQKIALRAKNIQELIKLGLWQKNKTSKIGELIQRIAVITSLSAAGKADFEMHLRENKYGYAFDIHYFHSSMQGNQTSTEVCRSFESIAKLSDFDLIVIIRGGGSKVDLSDFDHLDIAIKISKCKLPVITGIGHSTDESLADLSSYISLKTPTAVAEYIIQHNLQFEERCLQYFEIIKQSCLTRYSAEKQKLSHMHSILTMQLHNNIQVKTQSLSQMVFELRAHCKNYYYIHTQLLNEISYQISASDPESILEKGYAYVLKDGKSVVFSDLASGDKVQTILKDGKFESIITQI